MSTHCDRHDLTEPCPTCDSALERARVVGVLDAYGRSIGASPPQVHPRPDGSFHLVYPVQVDGSSLFEWRTVYGASEDAARAAAAKAIEAGEV